MPVRKRNMKRRSAINADQEAWLRGERHCGFIEFLPDDQLEALWEGHGNHDAFYWKRGMDRPVPRL